MEANHGLQNVLKGNEMKNSNPSYVSTTNACKLCKPLGACLAFRGVEGAVPFLHGSQGCATYMRRYIISHYREPMDIASSSLGEKQAVYGGGPNLKQGLGNVMNKYGARLIGVGRHAGQGQLKDQGRPLQKGGRAVSME